MISMESASEIRVLNVQKKLTIAHLPRIERAAYLQKEPYIADKDNAIFSQFSLRLCSIHIRLIMKKLSIVFVVVVAIAKTGIAQELPNTRFELTRYRGMGGVDITLDDDTPANANLVGPSFNILGIGFETTVSNGIEAFEIAGKAASTSFNIDDDNRAESLRRLLLKLEEISSSIGGTDFNLEVRNRVDIAQFDLVLGDFNLHLGIYSKSFVAAELYIPDDIESGVDLSGPYLDFGAETDLVRAAFLSDNGLLTGYSYQFDLSQTRKISLGAQLRGVYRIRVPSQLVTAERRVSKDADLRAPDDPDEVEILRGFGFGIDLYSTLLLNDLKELAFGLYLEDLVAPIFYNDKSDELATPRLGVGTSIRPLWKRNGNDLLIVGLDVENIETLDPTVQIGAATIQGTKSVKIMPAMGLMLNRKSLFRTKSDIALSAGLSSTLAVVYLDLAIFYNFIRSTLDGSFYLGFRM